MRNNVCFPKPLRGSIAQTVTLVGISILLATARAAAETEPSEQRGLRAGAATSNITPPLGALLVGNFQPLPATHVHDELLARCLVLHDGQTTLAFVIADNGGIPREVCDAAKQLIHGEIGLPVEHVMVAATHTHSAASVRGKHWVVPRETFTDYQQFVARRIADAVRIAWNNLEPAQIGWGSVDEPSQVFNRRWFVTDPEQLQDPFGGAGKVRTNPPPAAATNVKPAGPTDPEIGFVSVQSRDGRPIALLANYSLHYVGGVPGRDISADYFGKFADRIQQFLNADRLDPPFVGILSNGNSGDVINGDASKPPERFLPYERINQVASVIAQRVYEVHQNIEFRDDVSLAAAQEELTLGVRKPTAELISWAQEVKSREEPNSPRDYRDLTFADLVLGLVEAPDASKVVLQTFRVGDVAFTANPFEMFAETGLAIKEQSPFELTFNVGLANGHYAYLPTPRQHELGGYETWLGISVVETAASEKVRSALLNLLDQVRRREPRAGRAASRPGTAE